MTLGQEVKDYILYNKEVPVHFLEASVSGNRILLYGVANSQSLVESALAAAREITPDCEVKSEIQVVQEYTVMP
jgi:hypothetical protein